MKRGFTLIELLAVIAIIVLLLSILSPALVKARDRGYQSVCMSNVRQVNLAIIQQSGENNGLVTSPNWGTRNQHGWLTYVNRWPNLETLQTGLCWPYLNNYKVYRCPADIQPRPGDTERVTWYDQDTRMVTTYNMNGSACGFGKKPFLSPPEERWDSYKMTEFLPSDVLFWEGNENAPSKGYWWDGANYPWEGLTSRHFDGGTIASLDGRVERISTPAYYALSSQKTKNRLWNVPWSANGR